MSRYSSRTALIVVDAQNDFADPSGSLYVRGGDEAMPFINDEIAEARRGGAMVVYSQDWHPPSTPHFAKDGGIWPDHCVGGTWGAELHPELDVAPDALRIRKGVGGEDGYSAFTVRDPESGRESPTGLQASLENGGIIDVVLVGLATDYCVVSTAVDAVEAGFATTLLADGVRAVDLQPGDGSRAVARMTTLGVVVE